MAFLIKGKYIYTLEALVFGFLVSDVICLTPPSYISPWVFMDSDDPSTTFQTFSHGFGVYPIKAEVQVMSPTTGFIYPGVNSGYGGNDDNSRGGVICIYNDNDVRLYGATNQNTASGKAYIIYTGTLSWTPENQETSTTGYVRVRVWHPNDLPPPDVTLSSINMKATGDPWPNYREESHSLGVQPALVVMQYLPAWTVALSGWVSEGQGASSRALDNPNLYWGGVVYGVSATAVRFWTAYDANYALFSVCDGWGFDYRGADCMYIRTYATVYMWKNLGTTETYSHSELHDTSDTGPHEHSLHPLHSINIDEDILTVTAEATSGNNAGYHFTGTGSAMVDNAPGCGGIIYAYSNTTSSVRLWHPTTHSTQSGIIHVVRVGGGSTNQQLSSDGNVKINLYKPSVSIINTCLGVDAEPGVNVNVTLTMGTGSVCVANYTCFDGHYLASGDLIRDYDINTAVWTGSPPDCQAGAAPMGDFWFSNAGINTVVNLSDPGGSGIQAAYACQTGYSYIQGDYMLVFDQSTDTWNGTALECQIVCLNPLAGENSNFALSSAVATIGTVASYSCLPGFEPASGDISRVCHGNGAWTGSVLNCSAIVTTTTTTTVAMPTTTNEAYTTVCINTTTIVNITTLLEVAEEIVKNLTVDTKTTSSYLRTLTSAKDARQSSQMIGLVGAFMCAFIMGLIVLPDMFSAVRFIYHLIKEHGHTCKKDS